MKTIIKIISIYSFLALLSCEDKTVLTSTDDKTLKAIGSFQENVDKEIWGDFNLVLELDKSTYSIGEPINVLTYFHNIGNKVIILDGILPYRQSANPPTIEVQLNDSLMFRTCKFMENLNNENDIIIEPNEKVELNKFNLLNVEGQLMIRDKVNNLYYGADTNSIKPFLSKGTYKIHAFFHPTPQVYSSHTDTLIFSIE